MVGVGMLSTDVDARLSEGGLEKPALRTCCAMRAAIVLLVGAEEHLELDEED